MNSLPHTLPLSLSFSLLFISLLQGHGPGPHWTARREPSEAHLGENKYVLALCLTSSSSQEFKEWTLNQNAVYVYMCVYTCVQRRFPTSTMSRQGWSRAEKMRGSGSGVLGQQSPVAHMKGQQERREPQTQT